MGFFLKECAADARQAKSKSAPRVIPIELMKRQGCNACPLDEVDGRRVTPKFKATGPEGAEVYVLLQSPSVEEDEAGRMLRGPAAFLILDAIPRSERDRMRVHYAVKCRS